MSNAAATGDMAGGERREPRHVLRIVVIWLVLCAIAVPLIVLLLGPQIPPGRVSLEGHDQQHINILLTALAIPVLLGIWVYFGYAMIVFRHRGPRLVDGPPLRGHAGLQISWIVITTALVLLLAVLGTIDLFVTDKGAGGGQGPSPLVRPHSSTPALEVQVIGQQWSWTFRYPAYGGVETQHLELPAGRVIAFHVTSLDVVHSFWAIELAVKADANPGVDNVAYVRPLQIGSFQIRCAELCGLWHAHMADTGRVVSAPEFSRWIAQQEQANAYATKQLPPYAHVYYPQPLTRGG